MLTRILAYGFAFFLLFLEWLLRKLANIDSHEFMGPTLAAAGVGFLVPLTTAKNKLSTLPTSTQLQLNGYYVISSREQIFVDLSRMFLFVLVASWAYDLFLVCTRSAGFLGLSPVVLGLITYFVAVVLAEVKEAA
jgi:hypothetical protein